MTDNYYKALGLPTDFQISEKFPRLVSEPYHEQFKTEAKHYGAKWMRDLAASRIKEVATGFADFVGKQDWQQKLDGRWYGSEFMNIKTTEELFDLFIKERSGE